MFGDTGMTGERDMCTEGAGIKGKRSFLKTLYERMMKGIKRGLA